MTSKLRRLPTTALGGVGVDEGMATSPVEWRRLLVALRTDEGEAALDGRAAANTPGEVVPPAAVGQRLASDSDESSKNESALGRSRERRAVEGRRSHDVSAVRRRGTGGDGGGG